jgi:hypothetical protein
VKRLASALAALLLLAPASASAAVHRYAILVGSNDGDAGEVTLRYAESDATRVGKILRDMGEFQPEDVLTLADVTAEDLRRSLIDLNTRIRASSDPSMLFVFYSGHADAEAIHLRGTRLDVSELRNLVYGSPATARILVIDACRSGAVTRVKGGHPGPSFAIDVDEKLTAEGVAILTSSAAGEDSQESDQLGASFFTHFFTSGMLGAADSNGDGIVSLSEAFTYASERTLVATAGTMAGPQHPTYRFDLGGHSDLVLTSPGKQGKRFGVLEFHDGGSYLVQKGGWSGPVVAEVATGAGTRHVALLPGDYYVTFRSPDHLRQGKFDVGAGDTTRVNRGEMGEVAYAQLVRKGGIIAAPRVISSFAGGGIEGSVQKMGAVDFGYAGVRIDQKLLSLEVRVGAGQSHGEVPRPAPQTPVPVDVQHLVGTVGLSRAFDVGRFALGGGAEVGGVRIDRHPPAALRDLISNGYLGGLTASIETRVWKRIYARVDGTGRCYLIPPARPIGSGPSGTLQTRYTAGANASLGFYF